MKKLAIVAFLLVVLNGCSKVEETPVITEKETVKVTETPVKIETIIPSTTTVEILEREPLIEDEPAFYLSDYERWVVECMVMGESGGEDYIGQVLVAHCILNACSKDNIQPSEVRVKYKYSGWCEDVTGSVKDAVSAVFDDGYKYIDEFILWFYAPKYSEGKFHNTQRFVLEHGGHRFYTPWE